MKKVISAILGVVLAVGFSGVALARDASSVDTRVQVNVVPTITVSILVPAVTPAIQPGTKTR